MLQEVPGNIAFLLLDGVPLPQSPAPGVALCALGLTINGTFHPLETRPVAEEDEQTWVALLRGLRAHGVQHDPLLICCDGHPAVMGAIRTTFPRAMVQLSVPHRLAALSSRMDPSGQASLRTEARRIFQAHDRDAAVARFLAWRTRWLDRGERAVRELEADLPLCLAFYRFPVNLRGTLRSVSAVKRSARRSIPAPVVRSRGEFVVLGEHTPCAPLAAPPSDAQDEGRNVQPQARRVANGSSVDGNAREVRRPRGPLAYEFWAAICLTALLVYIGAADSLELPKLSVGAFSKSPRTFEQQTAPNTDPVKSQDSAQAPNPVQPNPIPPTPVPASTPLPSPAPAPPQPARGVSLTRGVIVVISATGTSWIRVSTDGVKVFENVLRPGEVRRWSAKRILQIRAGNAGAVDITVNGRRLGVLGGVGQIAARAFTRSSPGP